jgi:hypothetical protein
MENEFVKNLVKLDWMLTKKNIFSESELKENSICNKHFYSREE